MPGAVVFGQLVFCLTAQLPGTAMAIVPRVYVFQPEGIDTVVLVDDAVVELPQAATRMATAISANSKRIPRLATEFIGLAPLQR